MTALQFSSDSDIDRSQIFSVSEITSQIKTVLETTFPFIWVEGEISNYKYHTSGHMYFTLKDEYSELKGVMFRGDNRSLRFSVEDGMNVLALGNIAVYERRGLYQLIVRQMEPAGLGTLYLAFEALKKKLAEEGLFSEERKKSIPRFPEKVGIITSGTGAAIQDIQNGLNRRAPHLEIFLRPTVVQGEEAADDIVAAIKDFLEFGEVDVLIVGRGGGSLEDIWPFNEEKVARTIADCPIPIISAVGHESDFTITDFVADLRASTPSEAAELVSPSREELLIFLKETNRRCRDAVVARIEMFWQQLDTLVSRYGFQQPHILYEQKQQRLTDLMGRLSQQIHYRLSFQQSQFQGLKKRLFSVSPNSILQRGYSIAFKYPNRQIVSNVNSLDVGQLFGLKMSDGEIQAEARKIRKNKKRK